MSSPLTTNLLPVPASTSRPPRSASSKVVDTLTSTLFHAALNTGLDAAIGAVGAAILSSAGHDGYDANNAAQIGAVGGAAGGATIGLLNGLVFSPSLKNLLSADKVTLVTTTGLAVVNGIIGFAIMNAADATTMTIGPVAAAFGVGTAVIGSAFFCFYGSIKHTENPILQSDGI